ncbi:hypothetical protein IVA98_00885 [Bradyrhizobium sp. 160]|uniref:hypothetical protein n=1 Tax=Bradyrhizobium sp. 160 TaxID=2782634 RepID=UPI001FF89A70|nr:hypothetical protein [Bradyrhizobium sp. 160]MCK1621830.1 hypothetical protein [Bradyrhizobium sp. 160]
MTTSTNRHEASTMTDEEGELERCKQEILRLTQLVVFLERQVVQLSEIVLRNVVNSVGGGKSERS